MGMAAEAEGKNEGANRTCARDRPRQAPDTTQAPLA